MKRIVLLALMAFTTVANATIECKGEYTNSEAVAVNQGLPDIFQVDVKPSLSKTIQESLFPRIESNTSIAIKVLKWDDNEAIDLQGKFADGSEFEIVFTNYTLKSLFPKVKAAIESVTPIKPEADYASGQKITFAELSAIMSKKAIRNLKVFYGLETGEFTRHDGTVQHSCTMAFRGRPAKK